MSSKLAERSVSRHVSPPQLEPALLGTRPAGWGFLNLLGRGGSAAAALVRDFVRAVRVVRWVDFAPRIRLAPKLPLSVLKAGE